MAFKVTDIQCETLAKGLRDFGYPDATGALVREELSKPKSERTIIGLMAGSMLEDAGIKEGS